MLRSRHVELVKVGGVKNLTGLQHGEDGSQHHVGNGDDSAFLTAALHNTFVLGSEVRTFLGSFDGGVSGFDQGGFEVNPGTGNPDGLLFACGLVVAGRQAGLTAQALGGAEFGHVCTNLRNDRNGKTAINAGDGTKQCNLAFLVGNKPSDDIIDLSNTPVDIVKVALNNADALFLFCGHIEALDGLNHI